MDDQQPTLFSFGIDDVAQGYFVSIAKWNRFMAIAGIVMCFLIVAGMVFGGSFLLSTFSKLGRTSGSDTLGGGVFVGVIIFYLICIAVYLIPCFFRLSFSNKMLRAIESRDQELLNESLKHFKTYSAYWGVLTIIGLALFMLYFVIFIIAISAGTVHY